MSKDYRKPHTSSGEGLLSNEFAALEEKKILFLQSFLGSELKMNCGSVSTYLVGLKGLPS